MSQDMNLKVIVIDDNTAIHEDFIKILMKNKQTTDSMLAEMDRDLFGVTDNESLLPNFIIETASQGEEGVEKIAFAIKNNSPYALAFVDIRMPPGWDGVKTIKRIWELDKNIQVVICTAYSDYTWEETIKELGKTDNLLILKKPFDNIAVRQLACALTKKWQLMKDASEYTSSLEERVNERTQSLSDSLSRMYATLESSADGIIVFDSSGSIDICNKKFIKMWSLPDSVIATEDSNMLFEYINSKLTLSETIVPIINEITENQDKVVLGTMNLQDGRVYEYYSQPYTLENKSKARVWSFRDITNRAFLEKELQHKATHDILTGLPNRVLLQEKIKNSMRLSDENKNKFGILFLDIDRFKLINDSLSHEAGDEVLRQVSNRFQEIIRKADTLARLGGDEFVIILNDVKTEQDLRVFANKLLAILKDPFIVQGHELFITTSIGIGLYPNDGNNIDELLRNADNAMYLSKKLGANQFNFYTQELNNQNIHRLEQEASLRQAIAHNEFILFYQPQIDLNTGQLVSVEALIRWKHPTDGIILPMDFIPLAEESGLIVPIGEWVLRTACSQIKKWQNLGLPLIRVAVNVTTKQFRLYDFVKVIKSILDEYDLDPHYLEIELTENMLINNVDMINMITNLKKLGVQISLDDFGTGYSSLNYLRELPIDRIKIDQTYVQNIDSDRGDDVIIKAIIAMASSLKLEVIAEGVETERQIKFLQREKCKDVQGHYFSKPLSSSECEKYIKSLTEVEASTN